MKTYTPLKSIQNFDKKALLGALLAAGMAMGSAGVCAATATGAMAVDATLTSSCTVSASTLSFGSISALNVTADVTADTGTTLQIACSSGTTTPVIYSLPTSPRILTRVGGGTMAFNLSQTAGATADNLAATATGEAIGNGWTADGAAHAVIIYGRIPTASFAGQPVGAYSATIAINVEYS
ncbi:conserved exported hypothetical protein [Candidatus Methylobacter favarea]|uniref:Spore coat protein U/FanG domain-containing protein n=1 Tax=Candidatus Methylobacter favarea TaxID=2707345 RepID=A0A8S0YAZ1_9GAMM|nr:spore coat protein U domain-containing protein [Candidatus Methylobacter favarea]CAA9892817.1 conserved exported hypothetical protein [Candidatus Methylobacter favarea]